MDENTLLNAGYLRTIKNDYLTPPLLFESPFWVSPREVHPFHIHKTFAKQFICARNSQYTLTLLFTRNEYPPLKEEGKRVCCPPNNWELTATFRDGDRITFELDMEVCRDNDGFNINLINLEYGFMVILNGLKSYNIPDKEKL